MSGSLPPAGSPGSWKLAPDVAAQAQGLVVSGFCELPAARALLLRARPETRGGAWIGALETVAPITAADGKKAPSVALAFTGTGLAQLGLDVLAEAEDPSGADRGKVELVDTFALPFVEGMMHDDRRRRLSDAGEHGEVPAVIAWSAGSPRGAETPVTVHAMLLVYEVSHEALVAHVDAITTTLAAAGVDIVRSIVLDLRADEGEFPREHFGFVDGISQPIPYGEGTSDGSGKPFPQDPLHGVPLGEVLLGHRDAHGHASSGPFLPGALVDGVFAPSPKPSEEAAVDAMTNPGSQKLCDLGLNGSYLVVRELRQDVKSFWDSFERQARELNARDPNRPPIDSDWLAARVIGRTRDGHMLRPGTPLPPGPNGEPDNDFLFFREDRLGRGCPMGSHIRRANPRDGLAYKEEVCADLLRSTNAHRILRRGRKFGGDVAGSGSTGDEGLLFICLNGDIARQFEFVQQNWLLNPNFATLFDEVDPLVGPKGVMTLPDAPLRRRVEVETYVTLVGGDYFFLPSLPTLRILAALPP